MPLYLVSPIVTFLVSPFGGIHPQKVLTVAGTESKFMYFLHLERVLNILERVFGDKENDVFGKLAKPEEGGQINLFSRLLLSLGRGLGTGV